DLRAAGVRTPILVLGGFVPDQAELLLEHDLTPALFRREQAEALGDAARRRGVVAPAHGQIDPGMGRLGGAAPPAGALAGTLAPSPEIRVEGAFSHLAAADEPADPFTTRQLQSFLRAVNVLREHGLRPAHLHLANSAAILDHRATWLTLARPGLLLYG